MSQQPETLQRIANFLRSRTRGIHPSHSIYITLHEWAAQVERLQAAQVVATLHDDGYWTPAKSEAGRALNERLMRVGTRVEVCLPSPPAVAPDGALIGEGTKPTPKLPYLPESRTVAEIQAAVDKVAQAGGADERLTDAQIVGFLEAAGVEFQSFMGGIGGNKHIYNTAGSQPVSRIVAGVRAALAAQPARVALSDAQIEEMAIQEQFLLVCDDIEALADIVRAVELAHGITPGDGRAPALHCKKCHADRAKEGCRNQYRDCPFTGTAQPTKDTP